MRKGLAHSKKKKKNQQVLNVPSSSFDLQVRKIFKYKSEKLFLLYSAIPQETHGTLTI